MKLRHVIFTLKKTIPTLVVLFFLGMCGHATYAIAASGSFFDAQNVTQNARVDTSSAGLVVKVAPGELLPISIKLLNFGGGKKVDVIITYGIFNSAGDEIYSATETVAVETTANFIKTIQIPFNTPPGRYTSKATIQYQDQTVPATTEFPFTVENKIIGLFQSDFYFYGIIILVACIITSIFARLLIKNRRAGRLNSHEYFNVPSGDRIFYEIISDTIMQMRYRVGDKALDIAKGIEDLKIDQDTGKVLYLGPDRAKVVAMLILKYEKLTGQKMSFAIKKSNGAGAQRQESFEQPDKNLVVIRK